MSGDDDDKINLSAMNFQYWTVQPEGYKSYHDLAP